MEHGGMLFVYKPNSSGADYIRNLCVPYISIENECLSPWEGASRFYASYL